MDHPPSDPNTCCVCRGELNQPTKTLPCLHAACSLCLDRYLMGEVFKCPSCRAPFEPDDIRSAFSESRKKITRALRRQSSRGGSSSSSLPGSVPVVGGINSDSRDDNPHGCEGCSNTSPRTSDCAGESAPRNYSSHQHPIPTTSSTSPTSEVPHSPTDTCPSHPRMERSCYCRSCLTVCCPECAFDSHRTHSLERLSAVAQDIGNDEARMADQVALQSPPYSHPHTTIPEVLRSTSPPPPYSISEPSTSFHPDTLEYSVQHVDNTPEALSWSVEMDRERSLNSNTSVYTNSERNLLANEIDGSYRNIPITELERLYHFARTIKKSLGYMMTGLKIPVDIEEGYRMFAIYIQERKSAEQTQNHNVD